MRLPAKVTIVIQIEVGEIGLGHGTATADDESLSLGAYGHGVDMDNIPIDPAREGVDWICGHHEPDSEPARALRATYAIWAALV